MRILHRTPSIVSHVSGRMLIRCDRFLDGDELKRIDFLLKAAQDAQAPVAAIKLPPGRYNGIKDAAVALLHVPALPGRLTVRGVSIEAERSATQPELCVWAVPASKEGTA